ncbi:MAG TPA: hypothetical protein VNU68_03370 [Verrucomicrobiae bacterium]|nr:hypothetical protein [Verrucomicrobiae bacterium]
MCGIAGILDFAEDALINEEEVRRMLAVIRNRGPDQFGIYRDRRAALGSARLSIVDLGGGQQPICNEDGSRWIVFNGEIFNHVELRPELEAFGHRFATESDTEVLLHMYEQYGPRCLERLNGQFAFAVWDNRDQTLFLARDRLGVRPLFYTWNGRRLIFGSAIKALLTQPQVPAEIDPASQSGFYLLAGVSQRSFGMSRRRSCAPPPRRCSSFPSWSGIADSKSS